MDIYQGMATMLSHKIPSNYFCELCDYHTSSKKDFNKHKNTRKHQTRQNSTECQPKESQQQFTCQCGKSYKDRTGLWKHRKKCKGLKQENNDIENNNDNENDKNKNSIEDNTRSTLNSDDQLSEIKNMFFESIKQNIELQKQLSELIPKVGSTTNNNTTHNTTHNTTTNNTHFNLNFFLNEQCKDAIPLIDFVKSLQYDFDQLEYTGKHGFVEGVSKIIMDAMNQLDITKRPIHCTDVKRETFYVKDDESWKKEGERNRSIKTAIHNIRNRNLACVPEWIRAHPNCKKMDDPNNDLFIEIIGQYMDASETEFNKVIKTIAKSLTIPKSEYGRKECPVVI